MISSHDNIPPTVLNLARRLVSITQERHIKRFSIQRIDGRLYFAVDGCDKLELLGEEGKDER